MIDLTAPAPRPVPPDYVRELLDMGGLTQVRAAHLLHVSTRAIEQWCAHSDSARRTCPWAAADRLRLHVAGLETIPESDHDHASLCDDSI